MFLKEAHSVISKKVAEIINQKPLLSNYYLNDLDDSDYYQTEKSIIIRKKEDHFFRLYCVTTEASDLRNILSNMVGNFVINIPTKGSIESWSEILQLCGFNQIGIYERYVNLKPLKINYFNATFAEMSHFNALKKMMYNNFNMYIDYLPNDNLLKKLIENNQIIIHIEHDKLVGLFIFAMIGKKCDLKVWIDRSGDGLFLLLNLFGLMNQNNILFSHTWINSQNEKSKKIHQYFGYKLDNLKDYIFHRNTDCHQI